MSAVCKNLATGLVNKNLDVHKGALPTSSRLYSRNIKFVLNKSKMINKYNVKEESMLKETSFYHNLSI
jgi:hypothetical protein